MGGGSGVDGAFALVRATGISGRVGDRGAAGGGETDLGDVA